MKIKFLKTLSFILLFGIAGGFLFAFDKILVEIIGYGIILVGYAFLLLIMLGFFKFYKLFMREDLKFWVAVVTSYPVFLIMFLVDHALSTFNSSIIYTAFGRKQLVLELLGYSAVLSAIFSFVIFPIRKIITSIKSGK